jgi:hypothetical protein
MHNDPLSDWTEQRHHRYFESRVCHILGMTSAVDRAHIVDYCWTYYRNDPSISLTIIEILVCWRSSIPCGTRHDDHTSFPTLADRFRGWATSLNVLYNAKRTTKRIRLGKWPVLRLQEQRSHPACERPLQRNGCS